MILNHAPLLDGNEARYLRECVETGWVSTVGPFVTRFERAVAQYVGREHATATASGTAALHLLLRAMGVGPGDEVAVPALTFVAPANAPLYVGAATAVLDVDPETGSLDPAALERYLGGLRRRRGGLRNPRTRRRVAAVIAVDLLGHPADWPRLKALCRAARVPIVEDASQALGARLGAAACGALAEASVLSFNGNKIATCGGGGMVLGRSAALVRRVKHLAEQAKRPGLDYFHDDVGWNERMTNLEAAVGLAQVERLDEKVALKRTIAAAYGRELGDLPGIVLPYERPDARSTFWLYTIRLGRGTPGTAADLVRRLNDRGIQARPLWRPIHRLPAFRRAFRLGGEVADRWWRRSVTLPAGPGLRPGERARVVEEVRRWWLGKR